MGEIENKYETLRENQRFKNFKELSKYLGYDKPPSGNSKKRVIKELECYCKFRKLGNEIIIKEIFEEPKEKIDKRSLPRDRSGKKGKYKELLESLVLFILSKEKKGISMTYLLGNLSEDIGLYNKNQKSFTKQEEQIIENLKSEERALLKTVLKNMNEKKIIILKDSYAGKKDGVVFYWDFISYKFGKESFDRIYEETKEMFINQYGRGFLNDIKLKNSYYSTINKRVYEITKGEFDGIYKSFEIILVGKKSKLKSSEFKEKIKEFQEMRREDLKRNKEKLWNKKNYELRQELRKELNYNLNMGFNIKSKDEIWELIKYKYKSSRKNKKDLEKIKELIDELFC